MSAHHSGSTNPSLHSDKIDQRDCNSEMTKGAALYGAGGFVGAILADQVLNWGSLSYRQFQNKNAKLFFLAAATAATGWYGGQMYAEECRNQSRNTSWEKQVVKVEGNTTPPANQRK